MAARLSISTFFASVIFRAIDSAGRISGRMDFDRAVPVDNFWHSVDGIVIRAVPARRALLETRPARKNLCPPISVTALDLKAFTARTGCPLHASYLKQVLWLLRACLRRRGAYGIGMSIGEYMLFILYGQRICSCSMASATDCSIRRPAAGFHYPGLPPPRRKKQLSRLVDAPDGIRGLQYPFAQSWPVLRDALCFPDLATGRCSIRLRLRFAKPGGSYDRNLGSHACRLARRLLPAAIRALVLPHRPPSSDSGRRIEQRRQPGRMA
jgi:hypothetical protein